jgi:hypothetical protein
MMANRTVLHLRSLAPVKHVDSVRQMPEKDRCGTSLTAFGSSQASPPTAASPNPTTVDERSALAIHWMPSALDVPPHAHQQHGGRCAYSSLIALPAVVRTRCISQLLDTSSVARPSRASWKHFIPTAVTTDCLVNRSQPASCLAMPPFRATPVASSFRSTRQDASTRIPLITFSFYSVV